jgi:hypothetical protein
MRKFRDCDDGWNEHRQHGDPEIHFARSDGSVPPTDNVQATVRPGRM